MNSTMMVTNLIILSNSMDGGDGSLFPHAWALLIWFMISVVAFALMALPWLDWGDQLFYKPTSDWMIEHNRTYERKRLILVSAFILISVTSAVVPLYLGL